MNTRAFTLVELLVVIALIVVLMAILAPALDRAVYQADIARCGVNLKAIGQGLTVGAIESQNRYPQRTVLQIAPAVNGLYAPDERPRLAAVLGGGLNELLNCPLSPFVDLERPVEASTVVTSYNLWHGWRTGSNEKALNKPNDRWTYEGRTYDVLAGDYEHYAAENLTIYSSHPDQLNQMSSYAVEADDVATSDWYKAGEARGLLDLNSVYTDGAVSRYNGVKSHPEAGAGSAPSDERFEDVPLRWLSGDSTGTQSWSRVPRYR